jgi:hypothetical protein
MSEPSITRQAAHVSAGSNLPIYRIVIHATCPNLGYSAASAPGTSAGTAGYFTSASSGGSAQYIEGVEREDHCVADAAIAWHAPPNQHSIGIEITADGGNASAFNPTSHAYTRAQWLSPEVWPAVARAASRTRELCLRLGVPIVLLSVADLVAGKRGVCGHDDVSAAWHQTNHSDPGPNFPWAEFMALVMGNPVTTPEVSLTPAEKQEIADLTVHTLLVTNLGRSGPNVAVALQHAAMSVPTVAAIAAAVVAAIPAGGAVTQPMLEAALRTVLGSVDGKV